MIVEDDFSHEQSLLITEGETTVLVGGCAHGGIVNLLNKAEELLGRPVDFVVSGFIYMIHLLKRQSLKVELMN